MKIRLSKQRGSALVVTVITCAIIGTTLAAYLSLTGNQNRSVVRSQAWNNCVHVAEAGIEEALTHVKANGPGTQFSTNGVAQLKTAANLQADSWTLYNGFYSKTRTLSSDAYYVVTITSALPPVITSQGFTRLPTTTNYLSRSIRVTTTNNSIFLKGIVVKKGVTSNGNSVASDAFDSMDPTYSTNGKYDATKATDGGGIATISTNANMLNFGGGKVLGSMATGPGGTIPTSGLTVGTKAWAATHTGVQPGSITSDMNVTFPDVTAPFSGGASTPTGGTVGGVVYDKILSAGDWQISSGTLSGKVLVTGNARLYVTSGASVSFASTGSITIATNASLQMYVGSANVTLPNLVNGAGNAAQFIYYGLPTNTKITQNVNADFVGTIYAPNADITLGGNGTGSEQHIIGAVVGNSVFYNDSFIFNYDMNLGRIGLSRGYLISSWIEL